MLSKMLMRGATLINKTSAPKAFFIQTSVRGFRSDFVNPYKVPPVQITEAEKQNQDKLPVWERVFDFKKYMEHDGPLKVFKLQY